MVVEWKEEGIDRGIRNSNDRSDLTLQGGGGKYANEKKMEWRWMLW